MDEITTQASSLPAWVWILLGTLAGGIIRDLFSLRERRARTTRNLVDAQSVVIKDLSFAYELMARRPELRQWLEEAQRKKDLGDGQGGA